MREMSHDLIDKLDTKPKRHWNDAVVRWLKDDRHKANVAGRTLNRL